MATLPVTMRTLYVSAQITFFVFLVCFATGQGRTGLLVSPDPRRTVFDIEPTDRIHLWSIKPRNIQTKIVQNVAL
jgi:hypothetical protein